jgi:hypothetical protein
LLPACTCFITAELKESYESAALEMRSQLKARGERLGELMEAAAHNAAQLEEMRHEVEEVRRMIRLWCCYDVLRLM